MPPSSLIFSACIKSWIALRSRSWTCTASGKLYKLWTPAWCTRLGQIPIRDVGPLDIQSLYLERDDGKRASASCNKERDYLHEFFSWAVELGIADSNPVSRAAWPVLGRRRSERSRKEISVTTAMLEKILDWSPASCRRIILFLFLVGLRISEARSARWRWIQPDERDPESWVLLVPDTRKQRTAYIVPLGASAMRVLGPRGADDDLLFPESPSDARIRYVLRRAGIRIGVEGLSPHQLRKGCATSLLNSGMPLPAVQRFLGWSSMPKEFLRMLQESYYRGLESSEMRRLSDRLWPINKPTNFPNGAPD